MPIANASLLDEATAAAEAMAMMHRIRAGRPGEANRLVIAGACLPETVDVILGRAEPLGIDVVETDIDALTVHDTTFGVLLQNPDANGQVSDLSDVVARVHAAGALVTVATDLLAATLVRPPGEWGADVVIGSAQRFGVPMGYGGPHAAFFSTRDAHVRQMPGRLIGVSVDAHGRLAYRMALQTREQHIRRERATSNICTAQALLANIAAMYAIYHGPTGLTAIARRVHGMARQLADGLTVLGYRQRNTHYFDTLSIHVADAATRDRLRRAAESAGYNLRYGPDADTVGVALDETASSDDVHKLLEVFGTFAGGGADEVPATPPEPAFPSGIARESGFLKHPVFSRYHSELQMMRYLRQLERKDIGLDTSMIPLGSCTMKLNAASEMRAITWPEFSEPHPFAPVDQMAGYHAVFAEVEEALRKITGLSAVSLQPNSGAQGEFAGLMVIRAFHRAQGETSRDVVLIPASAHGTNPATASMAGMRVVVVACDAQGNVDVTDLRAKAADHAERLSALMITYPSTHGVFEDPIQEICAIVHEHGGQVYMDGANMNAQVGLTSAAAIGADVCHINLHKTFAIPHGGGGPGMGPIAVAAHLAPFLPSHPVVATGGSTPIPAIAAAPWG